MLKQFVIILKYACNYAKLVFYTSRLGNKYKGKRKTDTENGGSNGGGFDHKDEDEDNVDEGVDVSGQDVGACVDIFDDAMSMVVVIMMMMMRC
jgi:hypothetical protein